MTKAKKIVVYSFAAVCFVIMVLIIADEARAGGDRIVNNYYETNNYYQEDTYVTNIFEDDSGVSDSDLDAALAATMAASSIECSTSTRRHQAGVSTGYKSGKNAFALGYCKSISDEQAMTLGGKAAFASGMKPTYSIGLNWTW